MKILALDTSSESCSAAIIDEEKVITSFSLNTGLTHSQTLMPLIDEMCKLSNIDLNDMDAFACSVGPGSFTGLRIGIATIKGFALSLNKPVLSVSSLLGLAYNIPTFDGMICSILDANNDNVYAAFYQSEPEIKMVDEYFTENIDDFITKAKTFQQKIIFVGSGAICYKEKISTALKENAIFVQSHLNEQSAVSVARAALAKANKNEYETCDDLHPLYLRKSQAERMLEQSE